MLTTLLPPTSGTATVAGFDIRRQVLDSRSGLPRRFPETRTAGAARLTRSWCELRRNRVTTEWNRPYRLQRFGRLELPLDHRFANRESAALQIQDGPPQGEQLPDAQPRRGERVTIVR
jgi:hypothetical protein